MRKVYFLPRYSSLYVKHEDEIRLAWGGVLFIHFFFLGVYMLIELFKEKMYRTAICGLLIYAVLAVYYGFVQPRLVKWKRKYGMSLGPDAVLRMTPMGVVETLPYEIYEDAIRQGNYYYNKEGLVLGKGKYRMYFSNETEDSHARQNMLNCYEKLQEHITEKVPPLYPELYDAYKELATSRIVVKTGAVFLPVLMMGVYYLGNSEERDFFGYLVWVVVCLIHFVFFWLNFSEAESYYKQHKTIKFFLKQVGIRTKLGWSLSVYVWAVLSMIFLLWYNCRMVLYVLQ